MNRAKFFWTALESVFLLVFLVFFFVLTETRDTSSWIAFAFVLLSYFVLLIVPALVRAGRAEKDYRRPLFILAGVFFLLTLVLNVCILYSQPVSTNFSVLSNVALSGAFAIAFLAHLLANEDTANQQERRQSELNYVKEVPLRLRMLASTASSQEVSKLIEKVAETISYSPARSTHSVRGLEERISEELDKLETTPPVTPEGWFGPIALITSLAQNRNKILKAENGR